jgi:hypothetical protein
MTVDAKILKLRQGRPSSSYTLCSSSIRFPPLNNQYSTCVLVYRGISPSQEQVSQCILNCETCSQQLYFRIHDHYDETEKKTFSATYRKTSLIQSLRFD